MNPAAPGVLQPPEWEYHAATWTAWPSHPEYWDGHIEEARRDVAGMVRALAGKVESLPDPGMVLVWVDGRAADSAKTALQGIECVITEEPLGDIWFRDIAPVFVRAADGAIQYRTFDYNGWGGKFRMDHDETIGSRIAERAGLPGQSVPIIFEGGALDVDGTGLGLTTRSCLLNPNRNPDLTQAGMEAQLRDHLGVEALVWLEGGLLNDHTDGHVDNIARFVAPGMVVCQHPAGLDDPNRDALQEIASDLRRYRTPSGQALDVIEIPSPGKVTGHDGAIVPASHLNFYIANHRVLVPCYGTSHEEEALTALQDLFPSREVLGLPANGLLTGGGAFHCITREQPQSN